MKAKNKKDEVYLDVIKELVKERDKWEKRAKHPLPSGWNYGEDHPRIGDVIAVFPDILTKLGG